jgi:hypothetical protein
VVAAAKVQHLEREAGRVSSGSQTTLNMPRSAACAAVSSCPVSRKRLARMGPMNIVHIAAPSAAARPRRTCGSDGVTVEEAKAKSLSSTSEHAAPMAGPFTAQTIGCPTSSMSL